MGTWGPGVFENDHACDLCSIEAAALADKIADALAAPEPSFDEIEGPLVYVHLLGRLAAEYEVAGLPRGVVEGWKGKYLHAFEMTIVGAKPEYLENRRQVIVAEFDALIAKLPVDEEAPKPAPKKRPRKAPR